MYLFHQSKTSAALPRAPFGHRAARACRGKQRRRAQKKFRNAGATLLSAAILLLLVLLPAAPTRYAAACMRGVSLWATTLLPSLFPFLVLTGLLTKLGAAQRLARRLSPLTEKIGLPGCAAYCLFTSVLSGYPVGSRTIADLYEGGAITQTQARRMSALCTTCGPMFLLGCVGGAFFQSAAAGAVLLAAHLLAVWGVYLALYFGTEKRRGAPPEAAKLQPPLTSAPLMKRETDGVLAEAVAGSVTALLCVGGSVALFFVLAQAFADLHLLLPLERLFSLLLAPAASEGAAAGLVQGLLEATGGCAAAAASGAPLALPVCAFLVTFGGGSILAQQLAFLKKAGIRPAHFFCVKMIQGIAAFLLCLLLCALFP